MDNKYYTNETNVQAVIDFLKRNNIRKIIASPGTTNITFIGSVQHDPFFEIYSSVDERSAAYIACGLAEESGEIVVLSCTGATASRNYMPGLTEAYYRKLPIIAITGSQDIRRIGHMHPQVIDRSVLPNDVAKLSVQLSMVNDNIGIRDVEIKLSKIYIALTKDGGGPTHINLETKYSRNYSIEVLPKFRQVYRIDLDDKMPELPPEKIAIFVGSHKRWSNQEIEAIDKFCATNDAVVFCDHTSSYYGKYKVLSPLLGCQDAYQHLDIGLLIHIGEITGDYYNLGSRSKIVWRVNEDGKVCDFFNKLEYTFKMTESNFFNHYSKLAQKGNDSQINMYNNRLSEIRSKIGELPFSNIWIAKYTASKIPENSVVYFGILNTLRSWNFFSMPNTVHSISNVGGFGIDGSLSTVLGSSLHNKKQLYFCILGDLAFFYDMNALGNRHIGNNIRIMLINNGRGTEFTNFNHPGFLFGENADNYIAAAGHYGNKSKSLIKNYAIELGFEYIFANNKDSYLKVVNDFINPQLTDKPMIFEIFTDSIVENEALQTIHNLAPAEIVPDTRSVSQKIASKIIPSSAKKIIPRSVKKIIRKIIK